MKDVVVLSRDSNGNKNQNQHFFKNTQLKNLFDPEQFQVFEEAE